VDIAYFITFSICEARYCRKIIEDISAKHRELFHSSEWRSLIDKLKMIKEEFFRTRMRLLEEQLVPALLSGKTVIADEISFICFAQVLEKNFIRCHTNTVKPPFFVPNYGL
jgi:hypothetical protein